ncbi:MAG: hypothetical protein AB1782_06215 [Cyanobacteriota bacterium]
MKKSFIILLCILFYATIIPESFSDSPVTSTDFYKAYLNLDIVKKASQLNALDSELAEYLDSETVPIDRKAAVINALSWDNDNKNNADIFKKYLNLDNNSTIKSTSINTKRKETGISATDYFCIGYLTLMNDYFKPDKSFPFFEKASKDLNTSFTFEIIYAIAKAQKAMDSDYNKVWQITESVLNNSTLKKDMKPEAVNIIINYMELYQ